MDNKELKKTFGELAIANGFESAFGGWLKCSSECIVALDLQKSNFGNYYELNIKVYIQGVFGTTYAKSKDLIKKDTGDVFRRPPSEYKDVLDLDVSMGLEMRRERTRSLFESFIFPFTAKALSREGIRQLANDGDVFLLPNIKAELEATA